MAISKSSLELTKLETGKPKAPPFNKEHELNKDMGNLGSDSVESRPKFLAGYPLLPLNNFAKLRSFLRREFVDPDMDKMAPRLWVMTMQSYANVTPLHRQKVKGREIVVAEQGKLHLLWIYDRIFIKPLPPYLLSHAFWETYLLHKHSPLGNETDRILEAALGYIRTYFYLIRYKSDFLIATDPKLALIPVGTTWEEYCNFVSRFSEITDEDVSERWTYGEIRLTRLNLYSKIFLRKMYFHRVHGQYGNYFGELLGPVVFVFGLFSVVLSAMQVELAVEAMVGGEGQADKQWIAFWRASRYFSVISLVLMCVIIVSFSGLWAYMIYKEWNFALKDRYKRKHPKRDQQVVERTPTA